MRIVRPEILDSLAASHADAIASRRDLRLINAIMGNHRWISCELAKHSGEEARIVEAGAGDGTLGRALRERFPHLDGRYTAIDLTPRPANWPEEFTWVQADLWSPEARALLAKSTIFIANLVLHHFDNTALADLGKLLGSTRVLVLCEPARREIHVWQGRLLAPVARLNRVTRHDLHLSVRAGFRGDELPVALQLDRAGWRWQTWSTWLGAYRVVATRKDGRSVLLA
jgi:hypothetical protein